MQSHYPEYQKTLDRATVVILASRNPQDAAYDAAKSEVERANALVDSSAVPGGLNLFQKNSYITLVNHHAPSKGIVSVEVLGNAAAFDKTEFPKGHVISFNPDSLVDPMTLSEDSIVCLVKCEILPDADQKLDGAFFKSRLAALGEAVPQYSDQPISIRTRARTNNDDDIWLEEMGPSGAYGVTSRRINAMKTAWYVWAKCGAPRLASDVIESIRAKPTTWEDFVRSPQFIYWRNGVQRQACDIAFRASEKLGVRIATIDDHNRVDSAACQAAHITANPTYSQYISTIASDYGREKSAVRQYSQCAPVDLNQEIHLVAVSPTHGFVGVQLPPLFYPDGGGALPTTTGRVMARAAVPVAPEELDARDFAHVKECFVWEGAEKSTKILDRLNPATFRQCDDEFLKANFVRKGWEVENGIVHFDTVICKVANDAPRPTE